MTIRIEFYRQLVSLHATKLIKQTLEEIESSIEKYAPFRGTL